MQLDKTKRLDFTWIKNLHQAGNIPNLPYSLQRLIPTLYSVVENNLYYLVMFPETQELTLSQWNEKKTIIVFWYFYNIFIIFKHFSQGPASFIEKLKSRYESKVFAIDNSLHWIGNTSLIFAKHIRLVPINISGNEICIRFDIYGCSAGMLILICPNMPV